MSEAILIAIDVGTHESGLRGTVHKSANRLIEHEARLTMLERQGAGR